MIFGFGRTSSRFGSASILEPKIVISGVAKIFVLSPVAAEKKWNLFVTSFLVEGKPFVACQREFDFQDQRSAWKPQRMRTREASEAFMNEILDSPEKVLELSPKGRYDSNTQYRVVESIGIRDAEWDTLYSGNKLVSNISAQGIPETVQGLRDIQELFFSTPLQMGFLGNFKAILKSLQTHYYECLKSTEVSDRYIEVLAGVLGAGLGRVEAFLNGPKAPFQLGGDESVLEGRVGPRQSSLVNHAFHKALGSDFEPRPSIRTFEHLSRKGLLLYRTLKRQENQAPYVNFVTELLRVAANSSKGYVQHQLIISEFLFTHAPGFSTHKSGRKVVLGSWDSALDSLSNHPWVVKSDKSELSNYLVTRSLQRLSNGEKKSSPEIGLFCLALESAYPNVSTQGIDFSWRAYQILQKSNSAARFELVKQQCVQDPSYFILHLEPDLQVQLAGRLDISEFTLLLNALLEHRGPQARTFRNLWLSLNGNVVEQETLMKTFLVIESTGLFGESGNRSVSKNWQHWERDNLFHKPRYWKSVFANEKKALMMLMENAKSDEFEDWFLVILEQLSSSSRLKSWQLLELVGFQTGDRGLFYYADIHSRALVNELADAVVEWVERSKLFLSGGQFHAFARQIDSFGTDFSSSVIIKFISRRSEWSGRRSNSEALPLLQSIGNPEYIAIHMRNHISERAFLEAWPYGRLEKTTHENAWSHFYRNYSQTLRTKSGLGLVFSQLQSLPFSIRRDIVSDEAFKKLFVRDFPLELLDNLSTEQSKNVQTILSKTPSWFERSELVRAMLTGIETELVDLALRQITTQSQIDQYWLQMLESNSTNAQQQALDFLNGKEAESELQHHLFEVLSHPLHRVRQLGIELVQKIEDPILLSKIVNAQKESVHPDIWGFILSNLELVNADKKWEIFIDRVFLSEEKLIISREILKQKLDALSVSITHLVPIETLERLALSTNPSDRAWALSAIAREPAKFPSFLVESAWKSGMTNDD